MYEITTLPNGVRIAYEHMDAVRSAALGIWVGVGSRYEKKGEEGSAHFIEHMLFKGTKDCSAAALAVQRLHHAGEHLFLRPGARHASAGGHRHPVRHVL